MDSIKLRSAERFGGVLPTLCSYIFITWIKLLIKVLGKANSIRELLTEIFLKSGYGRCYIIIDCAELFTEGPKSLSAQAATWSDYKHHNTFKFLVGITPTGFISFHCSSYGVGASGTLISRESRFYDLLERDDEVTAERGFQIQKDLFLNFCRLVVPSSARVKSQMTKSEVKKTKEVANL